MVDLITEHIATWTAAQSPQTNGGRGRGRGSNGQSPHGIKKLRELILELAVRGKLVPQDSNDEPASTLLEKIAKEKARLIKEGKIKKQKQLPEIGEDEKPFELPETWEWARLTELYYSISPSGKKLKTSEIIEEGDFPVVDQGKTYVAGYTNESNLLIEIPGPVIVFGDHTTEKKYVDFNFVAGADGTKILRPYKMDEKYFYTYLLSCKLENRGYARHFKVLNDNLMTLPPLAEQHRIVAKVDELMALCDKLEQQQADSEDTHQTLVETLLATLTIVADPDEFAQAWQRIVGLFDTLFTTEESVDQLKQTILQLTVMGKLIPQDPNDEPASTLLEKIAKEKARLIKEGKIKKQKTLPKITEDEKPFELPVGWKWVRLGNYGRVFSGNSFKSGDFNSEGGVKVIKITNAGVGELIETDDFLPIHFVEEYEKYLVKENDLILALTRPYISTGLKISKCPESYDNSLLNQRVSAIRFYTDENYPFLFLRSLFVLNLYKERFGGTGLQPNLKVSDVTDLVLPTPPLAEQHRIVAKVDELMALCDTLKEWLHDAQNTQIQLGDAIVQQAVA